MGPGQPRRPVAARGRPRPQVVGRSCRPVEAGTPRGEGAIVRGGAGHGLVLALEEFTVCSQWIHWCHIEPQPPLQGGQEEIGGEVTPPDWLGGLQQAIRLAFCKPPSPLLRAQYLDTPKHP